MNAFISDSPAKTRPMKVRIYDNNRMVTRIYDTLAGFQLERYVHSLYPSATISVDFTPPDDDLGEKVFRVQVIDQGKLVETHLGIYQ